MTGFNCGDTGDNIEYLRKQLVDAQKEIGVLATANMQLEKRNVMLEAMVEAANKILADVELASCCEGCRVLEALTKVADTLLIPRTQEQSPINSCSKCGLFLYACKCPKENTSP